MVFIVNGLHGWDVMLLVVLGLIPECACAHARNRLSEEKIVLDPLLISNRIHAY